MREKQEAIFITCRNISPVRSYIWEGLPVRDWVPEAGEACLKCTVQVNATNKTEREFCD